MIGNVVYKPICHYLSTFQVISYNTAKKIQYTSGVQQLIRMYQVENNKWPNSLDDLKEVPKLPDGWSWKYDNTNGKVDIVKQQ